jgi:succinyl-diaminopimelate desuccinylase
LRDLLDLTAELVGIPSVSGQEAALADRVQEKLSSAPWLEVERFGDTVVARSELGRRSRFLLAGHLDTVPPAGNESASIEGDVCRGVGSCDMKGGIAVMLELAIAKQPSGHDLTFVFYSCEEVERARNSLRMLASERPELLQCDAAVLCEPTGCVVEAGCQGSLRIQLDLAGRRAHSARPWMGRNAIHRLGSLLEAVAAWEERRPVIDGCEFRESLQAVQVAGGVAGNVVPDSARLVLNHRFAPDRTVDQAVAAVCGLIGPFIEEGDRVEVVDATEGAPPSLGHPLFQRLVAASGAPARAKLGLTDVSLFAGLGVPATNFGPGDPLLAHRSDEQVTRGELEKAFNILIEALG